MAEVPRWRLTGDWIDVCRSRVPCGCTFARAPDEGQHEGIIAPGQVATWATAKEDEVDAFGFRWSWPGRSSKHFPFDWSGRGRGVSV